MSQLNINIEGTGGAYADILRRGLVIEYPVENPIRLETLDGGMVNGKPSVAIILEFPAYVLAHHGVQVNGRNKGLVILAQTSVKLLQLAAAATKGKYGDITGTAQIGSIEGGVANLTFSEASACPKCARTIPSSCKYCPECGAKL